MGPIPCLVCDELRADVVAAIARHIKLNGSLEIARVAYTRERVAELEPMAEEARVDREKAVAQYVGHRDSHADAAGA